VAGRQRRSWGAIRQLPSGRWQAKFTNAEAGRLLPAPDTFPTKKAANEWLATKHADLIRGLDLDDRAGERPLRSWWAGFERSMTTLKPKTQTAYEAAWRLRIEPTFGRLPVRRIRPSHVEDWLATMGQAGNSASKIIEAHGVLKRVLDRPLRDRVIATNPALLRKKSLPRRPTTDRPVLSPIDIERLARAMRRDDDRTLVRLLGYGGLRIGEALALRRRDLDPARSTLAIQRSVEDVKGRLIVGETKAGVGRVITLPRALSAEIAARCELLPAEADALIFGNRKGGYRRYRNFMRDSWIPAVESLNIDVRPHDLRATCASLLIDAGASVKDVQNHLGHADPVTTMAIYARIRPGKSEDLASRMDALIAEVK
jgi:integrase